MEHPVNVPSQVTAAVVLVVSLLHILLQKFSSPNQPAKFKPLLSRCSWLSSECVSQNPQSRVLPVLLYVLFVLAFTPAIDLALYRIQSLLRGRGIYDRYELSHALSVNLSPHLVLFWISASWKVAVSMACLILALVTLLYITLGNPFLLAVPVD